MSNNDNKIQIMDNGQQQNFMIIYNIHNIHNKKEFVRIQMPKNTNSTPEQKKELLPGDLIVNKKYTILNTIYEGQNSKILIGAFMKNGHQVSRAIKIQNAAHKDKNSGNINFGLKNQINAVKCLFLNEYGKLDIKVGFPHMFEYGLENSFNYMVTDIYGPNLAQLMKLCGGKFSARTTLLIALQILDRIEDVHNKKLLYCNMCPENFLIGLNRQSYLVYMVDFSKSTVYKSKNKNVHIPYQHTNMYENITFDHMFSSLNCQLGIQNSRRDDIQSFLYLILFLFKGKLPWTIIENHNILSKMSNTPSANDCQQKNGKKQMMGSNNTLNYFSANLIIQQQNKRILQIKRRVTPESLFKGLSFEIIDLMYYVKTLSFYEKPDYTFIRKKVWNALMETDYEQLRNNIISFDWNQRQLLDYEIYRDVPRFKLKQQNQKDQVIQMASNDKEIDSPAKQSSVDRCSSSRSAGNGQKQQRGSKRTSMSNKILKSSLNNSQQQKRNSQFHPQNSNIAINPAQSCKQNEKNKLKQDRIQQDEANIVDEQSITQTNSNEIQINEMKQQSNKLLQQKLRIIKSMHESDMQSSFYKRSLNKQEDKPKNQNQHRRKNSGNSQSEALL